MPQFKHRLKLKILLGHLARYRNLILWYLNANKKGKTIEKPNFSNFVWLTGSSQEEYRPIYTPENLTISIAM